MSWIGQVWTFLVEISPTVALSFNSAEDISRVHQLITEQCSFQVTKILCGLSEAMSQIKPRLKAYDETILRLKNQISEGEKKLKRSQKRARHEVVVAAIKFAHEEKIDTEKAKEIDITSPHQTRIGWIPSRVE